MKYFIESPSSAYVDMFTALGHDRVADVREADFLVFTGGSDVSPGVYRHATHVTTHSDRDRDNRCIALLNSVPEKLPKVGICRGAQFLCAMSGGSLYQNVSSHLGNHPIEFSDESPSLDYGRVMASSTHHQMMKPSFPAEIWAKSTHRSVVEWYENGKFHKEVLPETPEVVYFPSTNSLGFQPHPEFDGYPELRKVFGVFLMVVLKNYQDITCQKF
jgi:gamma-glutamyl-gamma-aminobutyrate hydrolase PuuD